VSRRKSPFEPLIDAIEGAEPLDSIGKPLGKQVRGAIGPGPLKEALAGTWLGHSLHPLLTDVVIGTFLSATLLDLLGGDDDGSASERLIAIGIAAYGPTALSGVNDWADTEPADDGVRRAGLVHATTNAAALSLYAASLAARKRGSRGRGKLLGLAGAGALGFGGLLGGHLSFAKGVGVDQTIFDQGPEDWTPTLDASELSDGELTASVADETPVVLVKSGGQVHALHDRCSHRGCSLAELGELQDDGVIECKCHGSRFKLSDGALLRGPATAPQPAFETREREGKIEVRRVAGLGG
jgi:nitrite reductase/ring-hydroxylating ferredoxin subunit